MVSSPRWWQRKTLNSPSPRNTWNFHLQKANPPEEELKADWTSAKQVRETTQKQISPNPAPALASSLVTGPQDSPQLAPTLVTAPADRTHFDYSPSSWPLGISAASFCSNFSSRTQCSLPPGLSKAWAHSSCNSNGSPKVVFLQLALRLSLTCPHSSYSTRP